MMPMSKSISQRELGQTFTSSIDLIFLYACGKIPFLAEFSSSDLSERLNWLLLTITRALPYI
mgnify:CR=1 FL=1